MILQAWADAVDGKNGHSTLDILPYCQKVFDEVRYLDRTFIPSISAANIICAQEMKHVNDDISTRLVRLYV